MFELKPESRAMMAHYRKNAGKYDQIATALSIPSFSSESLSALGKLLGGLDAARTVESVVRIKNYSDSKDLSDLQKAVSKLLKKDGINLPRGKRTKPSMRAMVGDVTPILLYFGLPCATSERSRLVIALRVIAEDIRIDGDPRDELRRLKKVKSLNERVAFEVVREAMIKGLAPPQS